MLKVEIAPSLTARSTFNENTLVFSLQVLGNSGTGRHATMLFFQVAKLSVIYVIFHSNMVEQAWIIAAIVFR